MTELMSVWEATYTHRTCRGRDSQVCAVCTCTGLLLTWSEEKDVCAPYAGNLSQQRAKQLDPGMKERR